MAAALLVGAGALPGSLVLAQDTDATGVIAGSVTADHGEVRALRVKAHDTVRRIAYTVYTHDGRYRIFNLPPSTYDVSVVEEAFESPIARRPAIDANGKIWAAHYFGNAISKIDPVTSAVTEYVLPLKDGNPYDVWPDDDDNLWVENGIYNSLVRFDQQTNEIHLLPVPGAAGAHAEARP